MLQLRNADLIVQLLDPEADQPRFGVRYCTGGYIFQVLDAKLGPLLTGPTYPESFNWFDGQGIPDAFNLSPVHSTLELGKALIIGTGVCDLVTRKVLAFAQWHVEHEHVNADLQRWVFATEQRFEETALRLTRTVSLVHRTVRSHTQLENLGATFVPVRWFPHPFYPQPQSDELLWTNATLRWREHPAYRLQDNGFIGRTGGLPSEGQYCALDHDAQAPLVLLQRHPTLGMVSAACSYVPDFFPIWGNTWTFSWEPFLERFVAPRQRIEWSIDYGF